MDKSLQNAGGPFRAAQSGIIVNIPEAVATGSIQPVTAPIYDDNKPAPERTPGLRLLDVGLYTILNNLGVFGISVAATYLTARGGDRNAAGQLIYGETGEFFQKRGTWLIDKIKSHTGMSHDNADMAKMVFFSFADGTLVTPVVKLIENRREKIGKWLDDRMGTTPEDLSVYDAEPDQTWTSMLTGRAATALIVVPTAVALSYKGPSKNLMSLNEKWFINPGIKIGEYIKVRPELAKRFGTLDVGELAKCSIFEAVYTSICTAGLYFTSRGIAGWQEKNRKAEERLEKAKRDKAAHPISMPIEIPAEKPDLPTPAAASEKVPSLHILANKDSHPPQRLFAPQEAALQHT